MRLQSECQTEDSRFRGSELDEGLIPMSPIEGYQSGIWGSLIIQVGGEGNGSEEACLLRRRLLSVSSSRVEQVGACKCAVPRANGTHRGERHRQLGYRRAPHEGLATSGLGKRSFPCLRAARAVEVAALKSGRINGVDWIVRGVAVWIRSAHEADRIGVQEPSRLGIVLPRTRLREPTVNVALVLVLPRELQGCAIRAPVRARVPVGIEPVRGGRRQAGAGGQVAR
jgi:hypothetical protein